MNWYRATFITPVIQVIWTKTVTFFFVDRTKDYIRRGGENISSAEIEYVVDSHPKVVASAAISIKSELSEDEFKIVVVVNPGEQLGKVELRTFYVERMPYFAVPRYVEIVERLF